MDSLPFEILLHIMDYVQFEDRPAVELVCRKFHKASRKVAAADCQEFFYLFCAAAHSRHMCLFFQARMVMQEHLRAAQTARCSSVVLNSFPRLERLWERVCNDVRRLHIRFDAHAWNVGYGMQFLATIALRPPRRLEAFSFIFTGMFNAPYILHMITILDKMFAAKDTA